MEKNMYLTNYNDLNFTDSELRFLLIIYNSTNPGFVADTENYKLMNLKYAIKVLNEVKGLSEKGYVIVNAILKKLLEAKVIPNPVKNQEAVENYDNSAKLVEELETLLVGKESQELHFPQVVRLIQRYTNKNNHILQ